MKLNDILVYEDTVKETVEEEVVEVHHDDTEATLRRHFKDICKLSKDTYNLLYKGKKTILGSLVKQSDKVLEVCYIDGKHAPSAKFISVTFRLIAEREISKVSKSYISLDNSRRVPVLVESKYMENDKYYEHRQKIVEQYL